MLFRKHLLHKIFLMTAATVFSGTSTAQDPDWPVPVVPQDFVVMDGEILAISREVLPESPEEQDHPQQQKTAFWNLGYPEPS